MEKRPLIFITNDDGFQSKGIKALINSVKSLGDIVVIAPDGPRSGMSNAISSLTPLRVNLVEEKENIKIYSCTGTPVDCVKLGLCEILDRKPDLLLSGVNHGSNASICVVYSGTMGAAMEGCIFKVPSIGFSLLDHDSNADFEPSEKYIHSISKKILEDGLPTGTCLNINIPKGNNLKGVKICRQTAGQWVEEFVESRDGTGKKVYWLSGRFENDEPNDEATDEWCLAQGYISVVPTKVDMTNHDYINSIKHWEKLF